MVEDMADRISQLPRMVAGDVAGADLTVIVDESANPVTTKAITVAEFRAYILAGMNRGSDANFVFSQGVASTIWLVNHNLGKYPAVQCFEDLGSDGLLCVEGLVEHLSVNQVRITLNASMSGVVVCN